MAAALQYVFTNPVKWWSRIFNRPIRPNDWNGRTKSLSVLLHTFAHRKRTHNTFTVFETTQFSNGNGDRLRTKKGSGEVWFPFPYFRALEEAPFKKVKDCENAPPPPSREVLPTDIQFREDPVWNIWSILHFKTNWPWTECSVPHAKPKHQMLPEKEAKDVGFGNAMLLITNWSSAGIIQPSHICQSLKNK